MFQFVVIINLFEEKNTSGLCSLVWRQEGSDTCCSMKKTHHKQERKITIFGRDEVFRFFVNSRCKDLNFEKKERYQKQFENIGITICTVETTKHKQKLASRI